MSWSWEISMDGYDKFNCAPILSLTANAIRRLHLSHGVPPLPITTTGLVPSTIRFYPNLRTFIQGFCSKRWDFLWLPSQPLTWSLSGTHTFPESLVRSFCLAFWVSLVLRATWVFNHISVGFFTLHFGAFSDAMPPQKNSVVRASPA